jgi:hypothetical protein
MIRTHDRMEYLSRETAAWAAQAPSLSAELRDYFAGYCMDALERQPAGSTQRIDQYTVQPFAAPTLTRFR